MFQDRYDMQRHPRTLYERLGGIYGIAEIIDCFSEKIMQNPMVGINSKNPTLQRWHQDNQERLPGLKFMRTLWAADVTGGPFEFTPANPHGSMEALENARRKFRLSPEEFHEVTAELSRAMDEKKIPLAEKAEVLAAFAANKEAVTSGYFE